MPAPAVPKNSELPLKEALELIQVVTDPTIMATDDAMRKRIPSVTPGAGRAVGAVDVGFGAYGLAECRGPQNVAAGAAVLASASGPTSVHPVPALHSRRPVQSEPSQYVCSLGLARTRYYPGSLGGAPPADRRFSAST
jgi:hypothetical protein